MKNFHYDFYIDTDDVKGMTPEEVKRRINRMYGIHASKKVAPRPKRRNDDIYEVDFMLLSATIVACMIGAIMLILGGLGL
jgi:hypothetical protein